MNKITHKDEHYYLAEWLEGKLSNNELQALVSETSYTEYLKMKKSFELIEALEAPLDTTLSKIKQQIGQQEKSVPKKKTKVISMYTKWVASVAAAVLLFFGISNYFSNSEVLFKTGFGEQKTIALLDGSEVILNAASTLTYDKKTWKEKRELTLNGEAYFKVTHGNTFTVNTKNGSVTVIGTQFNVNSQANYFTVVCYEGKVRVQEKDLVQILTPGKSVKTILGKQEKLNTTVTAPQWVSGQSTFKNEPLKFVIDELEKQFNVTFNRTAINQNVKFTGSFNNKKLQIALASVFKPMNITYQTKGNSILLHSK